MPAAAAAAFRCVANCLRARGIYSPDAQLFGCLDAHCDTRSSGRKNRNFDRAISKQIRKRGFGVDVFGRANLNGCRVSSANYQHITEPWCQSDHQTRASERCSKRSVSCPSALYRAPLSPPLSTASALISCVASAPYSSCNNSSSLIKRWRMRSGFFQTFK